VLVYTSGGMSVGSNNLDHMCDRSAMVVRAHIRFRLTADRRDGILIFVSAHVGRAEVDNSSGRSTERSPGHVGVRPGATFVFNQRRVIHINLTYRNGIVTARHPSRRAVRNHTFK
jgi:hypothetical protein